MYIHQSRSRSKTWARFTHRSDVCTRDLYISKRDVYMCKRSACLCIYKRTQAEEERGLVLLISEVCVKNTYIQQKRRIYLCLKESFICPTEIYIFQKRCKYGQKKLVCVYITEHEQKQIGGLLYSSLRCMLTIPTYSKRDVYISKRDVCVCKKNVCLCHT